MNVTELLLIAGIGFFAGVLGGLLGIGGSVIMIPGLVIALRDRDPSHLHLYQAAALGVAGLIAIPAALEQRKKGAIRRDMVKWLIPAGAATVLVGVALSNATPAPALRRLFAMFLLYVAAMEVAKIFSRRPDHDAGTARITPVRAGLVGALMGIVSGALGVGGGVIATPLAQRLCRLPLRHAIATSSAAMAATAPIGAMAKFATLSQHDLSAARAGLIALALAPTAMLGAPIGVRLAHALPLAWVRAALAAILLLSAWRMAV